MYWSLNEYVSCQLLPPRTLCFHRRQLVCLLAELHKNYLADLNNIWWKGDTWSWKKPLDFCVNLDPHNFRVRVGLWLRLGGGLVIPYNSWYVLPSL